MFWIWPDIFVAILMSTSGSTSGFAKVFSTRVKISFRTFFSIGLPEAFRSSTFSQDMTALRQLKLQYYTAKKQISRFSENIFGFCASDVLFLYRRAISQPGVKGKPCFIP
jgi:hypothetical protein